MSGITYVFDIETDGLLDDVTKIHCLAMQDLDTGDRKVFSPHDGNISDGLVALRTADTIIGHNIIGYDLPVIRKLYPGWKTEAKVIDTLIMSRLYMPDMLDYDYAQSRAGAYGLPQKLFGRHSLEAWGYRLG